MQRLNDLYGTINFWLKEFGLMEIDEESLILLGTNLNNSNNGNYVLDAKDLGIIDFEEPEFQDEGSTMNYPIFVIVNNFDVNGNDEIIPFKEIIESIKGLKKDEKNNNQFDFKIVIISCSPEMSVKTLKHFDTKFKEEKNEIKKLIKSINKKYSVKNLKYFFSNYTPEHSIQGGHIINSRDMEYLFNSTKAKENIPFNGRVYTVKLFDLVELYNKVGDSLFLYNVRLGIHDILDVGESIQNTLLENPEDFWFLNNGITLYAPNDSISYLNYLCINIEKNLMELSILNGAQTITSATRFFFDPKQSKEKIEKAKNDAYVMLRIIELDNSFEENVSHVKEVERINQLTIALNRQKPITTPDIVYTNKKILEINDFYDKCSNQKEVSAYTFKIIRRGDIPSVPNHQYFLDDLARILLAIKGNKPGMARSKGIASILKENEKREFVDVSLFGKWSLEQNASDNEILKKYIEDYKFVNFAMSLNKWISEKYKELLKDKSLTNKKKAILKFGRYHSTYFIVKACEGIGNSVKVEYTSELAKILINDTKEFDFFKLIFENWHLTDTERARWEKDLAKKDKIDDIDNIDGEAELDLWESNKFKKDNELSEVYAEIIKQLKPKLESILKTFVD